MFTRVKKDKLFDHYFDNEKNREIFNRVARKCYLPTNSIILELIDRHKRDSRKVKFSFSLSGVFVEQCEMFNKDVLESFRQLVETGCVELLAQTYYHSLAGLYPDKTEFIEQVRVHRQLMRDLFKYEPKVFENTELLYNNAIAKIAENLGYDGIYTEGIERILGGRAPNHIYKPKDCEKIKVLLRNYRLTDDIGFRFSSPSWEERPLTAEKYAAWLAATPGHCINIFPDYETFGEHQWPETGVHEFLRYLPEHVFKHEHLEFATPSEIIKKHPPVGEIDVFELGGTISWADIERDASCWLGNPMQWACYLAIKELEPLVKESMNERLLRIWRFLQLSDHLYYMFTAGGAPGEVHSYFSPYGSPQDAYITLSSVLYEFECRVRLNVVPAEKSFIFYKGVDQPIGVTAHSLKGFLESIKKVDIKSIEFHVQRGDFANWVRESLHDSLLANELKQIGRRIELKEKLTSEELRRKLSKVVEKRYKELSKPQDGLYIF